MPSGLPTTRRAHPPAPRRGQGRPDALLDAESAAYHAPGTCTFFGTANTNQLVVEAMGLHLPGASFVSPGTPLRKALTERPPAACSAHRARDGYTPLGELVDEKAVVNAIVALLATGGSTNHTMHLVAIAAAAGIRSTWDDFADLSRRRPAARPHLPQRRRRHQPVPRRGRYAVPDRPAARRRASCTPTSDRRGPGLDRYREEPYLDDAGELRWRPAAARRATSPCCAPPRAVRARRRHPRARRLARPRRDEGVRRRPRAARRHRPRARLRRPGRVPRRLRPRRARPRPRRRRPPPGPARERHAGAAQAHPGARRPDRPRTPRGARDGRPHVRRLGQGARGDPLHAGGGDRRAARTAARRRPRVRGRRARHARRRRRRPRRARARAGAASARPPTARAATSSRPSARTSAGRTTARPSSPPPAALEAVAA